MTAFRDGLRNIGRFELSSLVGRVVIRSGEAGDVVIPEKHEDQKRYSLTQMLQGTIQKVQEGGYCVFCDSGEDCESENNPSNSLGGSGSTLEDAFYDLIITAIIYHTCAVEIPPETWHESSLETVNYWELLLTRKN